MLRLGILSVLAFVVGCSTAANIELTPVKHAPSFTGEYADLTELDSIPTLIESGAVEYPGRLKAQQISGSAIIGFVLNKEGRPTQIQCVDASDEMFGTAAILSVENSRYNTPTKEGKAVSCVIFIPFDFDWRDDDSGKKPSEFTRTELTSIYSQSAMVTGYSIVSVVRESRTVTKVTLASEKEPPKAKILHFELISGKWLLNKAKTEDATLLIP